jgi:hypothetical protein
MPIRALFLRIVVRGNETMRRFVLMAASRSIEKEKAGVVQREKSIGLCGFCERRLAVLVQGLSCADLRGEERSREVLLSKRRKYERQWLSQLVDCSVS